MTAETGLLLQRWIRTRGTIYNGYDRPEHIVRTADLHAYRVGNEGMFVASCPACALRRGVQRQ